MKNIDKVIKSIVEEVISEKFTVEYDNFDLRNFQDITDSNPKLKQVYEEGIERVSPQENIFKRLLKKMGY